MGPEEEPSGPPGLCPPWCLLGAWAANHGVDHDLALLICACTAAHVAGPGLFFGGMWQIDPKTAVEIPAPTVISTAGDTGFERAVRAATASLLPIQRELLAQYGEPVDESVYKDPSRRVIEMIERKINEYHDRNMRLPRNPARDMDPDKQPGGRVRFILEGALPAKPVRFLKNYNLYTALAVGGIERLPRSTRWREARVHALSAAVGGYRHGRVSIRGFMRFFDEDLEWMAVNIRYLFYLTLPVESIAGRGPVPPATGGVGMREFDRLHRTVLRRVLSLRFSRADCAVDFRSGGAERWFRKLREGYWAESGIPTSPAASVAILPDLFVWYMLQLGKSAWLEIDEMEVAAQAVAAARRLRRRVAGFHDRLVALRRARERLALAMKLVARMGRLDRPCKRRDLARGLDRQRMDRIAPIIDALVGLGVFTGSSGVLAMGPAGGAHPPGVDDFMEALADVPHSLTRKLAAAEEHQAAVTATATEPRN